LGDLGENGLCQKNKRVHADRALLNRTIGFSAREGVGTQVGASLEGSRSGRLQDAPLIPLIVHDADS
jgi:hypothetical protein